MARGRAPEAEPHLKVLADLDTSPGATMKLALADYYIASNRADDATKLLEQIAQRKDAYAAAQTRAAAIAVAQKDPATANKDLDEVLARDPKYVAA